MQRPPCFLSSFLEVNSSCLVGAFVSQVSGTMGILSYFKPSKDAATSAIADESEVPTPTKKDILSRFKSPKQDEVDPANKIIDDESAPDTPINGGASHSDGNELRSMPSTAKMRSRGPSAPNSLFPPEAFHTDKDVNNLKCDVMVTWLYQQQMERLWTTGARDEGVVLKVARDSYTCCPDHLRHESQGFYKAVETLNVRCAMTVNTRVIKMFLWQNNRAYVPLQGGLRLQVLPSMDYLPRCQKHQFAAFIADQGVLVVWDDEPRHILDRAMKIEKALMDVIWTGDSGKTGNGTAATTPGSDSGDEKNMEKGSQEKRRRIVLMMPAISSATFACTLTAIAAGYRWITIEILYDGNFLRLLFILALWPQIWLALFFFQSLIEDLAHIVGPVSQLKKNSKFYSGRAPTSLSREAGPLPHVTIQMPVYKEGLKAVIEPTIASVKAAMSTYEMQGGTANIFVNDDGMQLLPEAAAKARQDFYDEHNIGWVARPAHNPKRQDGDAPFHRRGKFKKASNMNYAMWTSVRVEDRLNALAKDEKWSQDDEAAAYNTALAAVVEEDEDRTWADGNIRIGDYILLIDSDTRVPADCFLSCVSEMSQSPQVAIIQYASGVMNVTDSYFERGITFFTNLVYTNIKYAVATGDVAPFVGHNAVLRWTALQGIAYNCALDSREKWWSEATVSEDFDMALRLQTNRYLVRLGSYTDTGFKEGVSLTVYDELARWEKYAYGCSELVFHPLRYWPTRGPFTKLFIRFLFSSMPLCSKITISAYIGTYFALGSAWILTLANYFLTGWYNGYLDHFYVDSFRVYFAIVVVFTGLGNLALAILRYRTAEKSFFAALFENLSWVPMLVIFLGGTSLHISQAILSHLFSVEMTWGATAKEAENTTFFREVPKIIKKFKGTFLFCFGCAGMIVYMALFAPPLYRIDSFISIYPLAAVLVGHFALPIILNPGLMRFTW